jgi:hypothetical protein
MTTKINDALNGEENSDVLAVFTALATCDGTEFPQSARDSLIKAGWTIYKNYCGDEGASWASPNNNGSYTNDDYIIDIVLYEDGDVAYTVCRVFDGGYEDVSGEVDNIDLAIANAEMNAEAIANTYEY